MGTNKIGDRVTVAKEEFIQLCVAVQRCSEAQLNVTKRIASVYADTASQDQKLLADMGDAIASIGLVEGILKAVMDPPTEEEARADA